MKNVFNRELIQLAADLLVQQDPNFDRKGFVELAAKDIEHRELKDRAGQICVAFIKYLPKDYRSAVNLLLATLAQVEDNQELGDITASKQGLAGWIIMPMSQFVGEQGGADLAFSMAAMKAMTKRFSSEFGIRYLLLQQAEQSLEIMATWLTDPCHHVRRLVSEGTRPLLPWAMQLPEFKANPEPVIALLEQLKDDSSEYVRRSVANNLNDIAKDHPDLVANIAESWLVDADKNRTRLVKHACRTLIKQGHRQTLAAFGYPPAEQINSTLTLAHKSVAFGTGQQLTCTLSNPADTPCKILLDYVIYHRKANGKQTAKVFKWKELELKGSEHLVLEKHHAFVPISFPNNQ